MNRRDFTKSLGLLGTAMGLFGIPATANAAETTEAAKMAEAKEVSMGSGNLVKIPDDEVALISRAVRGQVLVFRSRGSLPLIMQEGVDFVWEDNQIRWAAPLRDDEMVSLTYVGPRNELLKSGMSPFDEKNPPNCMNPRPRPDTFEYLGRSKEDIAAFSYGPGDIFPIPSGVPESSWQPVPIVPTII